MSWSNDRTDFDRSIAVIIAINDYRNGIHPLSTPVNDTTVLANLLEKEYNYQEIVRLFPPHKEATLENINELFKETLPNQILPTQGDRLLFYFAGHGIARNSEDGPAGYLIPQDAKLGKVETFLPMRDLNTALSKLDCHHLLVILDCCFAGNFRWSSTRNVIPVPETIHREHYDRFIRCSAWQAITSAAHNQEALDFLSDLRDTAKNSQHSPFALALIEGLKDNKADLTGDGVITAPELYLYLRDRLISKDGISELQTPGLWPLQKHDRGEFIFTLPGFKPEQLTPAPPLDEDNNPYRGLQPFDEKHARFFFGRQELVEELYNNLPDPAHQDTMRRVMLRMVDIQGGEAVRRQVLESELFYTDSEENQRREKVIQSLVDARLVVKGQETGEPYLEPAHDFLVRGWTKLQEWQEQAQKTLSIEVQRRLTQAANDWKKTVRKQEQQGLLWNDDPRLALFEPM